MDELSVSSLPASVNLCVMRTGMRVQARVGELENERVRARTGGGERRGRWPMWKQCGKKQQRVEEEARSLRSFMEYVNWHRHPDLVPFQPVNRMITNCDRINEGLYYEDLISVYIN